MAKELSEMSSMIVSAENIVELKVEKGQNTGDTYYQVRFDALPTPEQKKLQLEYDCVIDMPHSKRMIFKNMPQFDSIKKLFESGDKTKRMMFIATMYDTLEIPKELQFFAKNPETKAVTTRVVDHLSNIVILLGETPTSYLANILRNIDPDQKIVTTGQNSEGSQTEPLEG